MLLLIDAGNTRLKWAALAAGHAPPQWAAAGVVERHATTSLAAHWRSLNITHVLASNVAGDVIATELTRLLKDSDIAPDALQWFRASSICAGVHNGYRQPQQLGSDRFASLIGARYLFPQEALLVVTCGTATTIDALEADGRFVGGMILPGLGTMAKSLAVNTAQLPQVTAVQSDILFADNTQDAIISGCISAQAGAIARALVQRPARCIISGGAAAYIAPYVPHSCELVDNLVLTGLAACKLSDATDD
jgi:type III pantothenate kinase